MGRNLSEYTKEQQDAALRKVGHLIYGDATDEDVDAIVQAEILNQLVPMKRIMVGVVTASIVSAVLFACTVIISLTSAFL